MTQNNKKGDVNKDIDVSRSEHQQAQKAADPGGRGEEQRQEGSKNKGNPDHEHGSHQEGQYQQQSDKPTMHPGESGSNKQ
ncbi:MAG: hypothetical protein EOP49_05730 [Sphingobacteriales bacterium]|nr:MAG: hypothetical protein EOP49_05730 [Sphingobacteriales bacterium]